MRRFLCIAASFSLCACFHATHVEKPDEGASAGSAQGAQPSKQEGGAAEKPHVARRPQKPGRPPLAASPSGLFVPGGVEKVQQALANRGYLDLESSKRGEIDAATSAAVRKFQSDQGIARTGNPDHETLRRLGLDADSLFRKSAAVQDSKAPTPVVPKQ
jgi:peptidoglycan hydrolase-like protein with peptidoglycan-binding domain